MAEDENGNDVFKVVCRNDRARELPFVYDGDFDSYREMLKNDFKEQALLKSGKSK